jgi:hypothetical protein
MSVQSALVAGAVSGSLSWTAVGDLIPAVRGLLISSLIMVLASITLATQQSTALSRLSSNTDGMRRLRISLGYQNQQQQWKPRNFQVLIWQIPAGLLTVSIFLFVFGLNVQIWVRFVRHVESRTVYLLRSTRRESFH